MTNLELVVGLFTFGGVALTIGNIYYKRTAWYTQAYPMVVGATAILWLAKIFG